jgi:hypothetical protein
MSPLSYVGVVLENVFKFPIGEEPAHTPAASLTKFLHKEKPNHTKIHLEYLPFMTMHLLCNLT